MPTKPTKKAKPAKRNYAMMTRVRRERWSIRALNQAWWLEEDEPTTLALLPNRETRRRLIPAGSSQDLQALEE